MTKFFIKISLLLALIILVQDLAFSHASYAKRNKCRWWLVQYKAKAKVNHPDCVKNKEVEKTCNAGGAYAHAIIYRKTNTPESATCGCSYNSTNWTGAVAEAEASSTAGYARTWKTPACNEFKAGGRVEKLKQQNSEFEGDVAGRIESNYFTFDYDYNRIALSDLSGFLEINSEDFINEYSILQIRVAIITTNDSGVTETEQIIFLSNAAFINGVLTLTGDAGGFLSSDFSSQTLQNGMKYILNGANKEIQLNQDIDSNMIIEVTLTSDVGNILGGESGMSMNIVDMSLSLNADKDLIYADITSKMDVELTLEIRTVNGKTIYGSDPIKLNAKKSKRVEISSKDFEGKGSIYVILLKAKNVGVIRTGKVIKN